MAGLVDMITQQLGSGTLDQLSGAIGADANQTRTALGTALPALVGALARNTRSDKGASSLASALERDHDGSVLDNIEGLLGAAGGLGSLFGGGAEG